METWLPMRYRDFYDVPRAIVVEHSGSLYLLDAPFDEDLDDYPDHYTVYRLPDTLRDRIDAMSWLDLGQHGERLGTIAVAEVHFDPSRRKAVDSAVLQRFVA